ncbi:uncharacterized protein [Primulina huaijiensis]|uniref:uncharacterized protein isoform X1 n=1 Tax=Primulina huaijiensis TaxID=1492673 RepID=UPI003CC70DBA
MKPSTQLSSAVFHLTPTRTRCDLIIISNDKKEKIASGLLNPFLSHLKTAQDQISKGGYSILLEPENGSDAAWFTKATLERFVRFVSTPEILERVHMLETEILQIEEAIIAQSCNDMGQTIVEDHKEKPMRGSEGNKSVHDNEEKAIVLYKPEAPLPEANGSYSQEGNSKVQLLKILETRKTLLQKEQGMAFARAVAAGFDIDHVAPLVSFAESFGAMRLLEACSRFINLWKSKHETGQWLELEASEVLPARSEFSAVNASGIFLSGTTDKHDESNHQLATESIGKSGSTNNAADNSAPNGQQEYFHGQFPHLVFPSWPMNNSPGAQPVFPVYPVQGMPYYPTYAGSGPFFQPPHWPMEHTSSNFGHQSGHRNQSSDGRDNNTGSEMSDIERTRSLDDMEMHAEFPGSRKPHRKSGGSNKKQSGMVVIRNINYITSKEKKSGDESNSDSDSDADGEYQNSNGDGLDVIHQNGNRSLRNKGSQMNSLDSLSFNNVVSNFGKDADDTHWQAFQNCLLREGDEHASADNKGMLAMENHIKRRANTMGADPLAHGSQDRGAIQDARVNGIHKIDERTFPTSRGSDDFIIGSRQNLQKFRNSLGALDVNSFEGAINQMDGESSQGMTDESLIVPFRTMSIDQVGGRDRSAIDIGCEIPSAHQNLDVRNIVNYEPDGLSLMPERGTEKRSIGYDLTLDYEMQVCAESSRGKGKKEVTDAKGGLWKLDKDKRLKVNSDPLSKQGTGGPIRKGKSSKMSPLEDARARAEKLRSYKADLQKIKKDKEAAEMKRIEALKQERQKRIAARGGSTTTSAKPSSLSPQIKQLPTKLSPATNKGSKFSDSEPGSSSPLQRSKIRTSVGASAPLKATKSSILSEGNHVAANELSRSASSLTEPKRESHGVTPDSKASMARIRRLSEPKTITNSPVLLLNKARSAESVSKRKLSEGPDRSKISAIINLDRSKAAMLPELKIKTSKSLLNSGENGSNVKGKQKVNGVNPSANAESNAKLSSRLHQIDIDDNPIVEKTVVMLEYEKPSGPTLHPSEGKLETGNKYYNDCDRGEKSDVMPNLADAHTPPPPVSRVDNHVLPSQLQKQSYSNEVKTSYSDYNKAHAASLKLETRVEGTVRTNVPDVKTLQVDKNSGTTEKTPVKQPKGFKRLLKFGKKNHSSLSADRSVDSECNSVDGAEHDDNARNSASSSEVLTLKNLILQDETSTAGNASQKSSRHFSLLSPFWSSKTSEKKPAS